MHKCMRRRGKQMRPIYFLARRSKTSKWPKQARPQALGLLRWAMGYEEGIPFSGKKSEEMNGKSFPLRWAVAFLSHPH